MGLSPQKRAGVLSWLEGILLKCMNFHAMVVHSVSTRINQQGDETDSKFDK